MSISGRPFGSPFPGSPFGSPYRCSPWTGGQWNVPTPSWTTNVTEFWRPGVVFQSLARPRSRHQCFGDAQNSKDLGTVVSKTWRYPKHWGIRVLKHSLFSPQSHRSVVQDAMKCILLRYVLHDFWYLSALKGRFPISIISPKSKWSQLNCTFPIPWSSLSK